MPAARGPRPPGRRRKPRVRFLRDTEESDSYALDVKTIDDRRLDAAERFMLLNARLIDRLRFAHLFRGGSADAVVAALRPYQNSDGGFGHSLEPDARTPLSQPLTTMVALDVLDELGRFDGDVVGPVCDYLLSITTPDRGVPFVHPSIRPYPRAPWWETDDNPSGSLLPTAHIAGLLHKHGVDHPWLEPATAFCWEWAEATGETHAYEVRSLLPFLDHAPDRPRAEAIAQGLGTLVFDQSLVALDPDAPGEVHTPLDFATAPDSLARRWFSDDVISAHLDALVGAQQSDGGWTFNWQMWTPITGFEWRGEVTVGYLARLDAYGRLSRD